MKRAFKRIVSLLLVVVMVFGSAPLSGFVGLDLPNISSWFAIIAEATTTYTEGYYTYIVDENSNATITNADSSIGGDVTIPLTLGGNPVTGISSGVFKYCDLTSIVIPDCITFIGYSAFYGCDRLTSVSIGNGVTWIGGEAFYSCSSLETLTIPNSVRNIHESAFKNCAGLTNVTLGNGVTTIGDYAFYSCNSLTSITIPDSVTSIGNYAFYNCDSLTSITIPDSVTSIGSDAFCSCTSLTSVTIPDSVTHIGSYSFQYCDSLTNITIPDSVTDIGYGIFRGCTSLANVTIGNGITSILDDMFNGCENLTNITIPDSVTSIGDHAFSNCTSLARIEIPDSVTSIGCYAFSRTAYYNDANNWDNDVLYINNHLVEAKDTISGSYEIKSGTLTIVGYAFYDCNSLKSITIPDGVTSIGDRAFSNCTSLARIETPDSVTSIGDFAFDYTAYYKNASNWENDVLYIGKYIIQAKTTISGSYEIKSGTLTIADDAFFNCNSISSIIIPDSVTSIGNCAFYGCTSLTNITIPACVTSIGSNTFSGCTKLTRITIPNSLSNIGESTFVSCKSLASITIPNSLPYISSAMFNRCTKLTSITIPDSVTSIGYYAFDGCESLTDVYYTGTEDEWNKISIKTYNAPLLNATIHFNSTGDSGEVPDDSEKYKNATITLDENSYTVKEPNSLTIEGTITCPDGVDGLLMSWSFDEIDVFYTASETTYETVSETEMRFSQTFTPKKAGKFKVYARLPNDAKAECTVTSYQEAVSAFISEHYQFVKSDKYNDFVAEEYAQELAESMRNNSSYHWNNFVSINFFENYYDLVLAELLTNDTTKQSVKEEIEKIFSSEYVDLTNKLFDFINTTYQDSLGPISEADFYLVFNADTPKVYEDTAIYKALTKGLEDKTLFNNVFEINELFGYAQKIADAKECAVEGIVDCVYYFAAINAYRKADEEIKAVITKAAAKTNNSDLKESLESFASIDSEDDYLGFAESLFDKFIDVGRKTAVKICFNSFDFERTLKYILNIKLKDGTKLADKVVKVVTKNGTTVGTIAQYANAVFAGVSLGMAVSELITNADDYSFYASKCTHAGDLAEVLLNVLNESAIDFKENKTLENAHFFDVAFNFYKDTQIYALNAMVESIYAQNSSAVAVIINKAKSASGYISTINRYKNLNCHKHDLTELINAEYYYVDEKYSGNKLIRVACPVDVYVYDFSGNLALSIENDFIEIFDERLDAYVLNSEKYICVPLDEEFTIKIVSTDDGEMDYSVFEFDENSEMTREVSKENISLVNGKTFEGKIDNIINTDADNYSLIVTDTQGNIAMDNDIDCVPATNISIFKSSVELKVGQSQGLVASISPINTTDKYVWISSDETVATVSENGTVNAIGEGNATIVAMVNDLIYAECEVNVVILKDYTVTWNIDGAKTLQTITEGDTITKPSNPTKSGYTFVGWSPEVPDTMPSYDLTFTAVFEKSYICPDCGNEILGENAINDHIVSEARMKATIKIKNNNGSKTINYGETLCLTAVTTNMPADIKIYWFVDGVKKDEGETFNVSFESGTKTVEVKLVDSNNNVLKNASGNEISDSESVTVKGGFFQKIISFFKNLFGANRTVVQAFKAIF